VPFREITAERTGETSAQIREPVVAARRIQQRRFANRSRITSNARMGPKELKTYCALTESTLDLLRAAMADMHLSARAYARAVHHAHERGILHRDLKPSNILMDGSGEPHVSDFGLAKIAERGPSDSGPALCGTPGFMSPEQAAGKSKELTTATDVFSLGAILYQLLTGTPPFRADNLIETLRISVEKAPLLPSYLNRWIDRDLEIICLKCLEKEPRRRYLSADALADDLERWLLGEPIVARRVGALERTYKWMSRKPHLAGLAGAFVLVSVFSFLAILLQLQKTQTAVREGQRLTSLAMAKIEIARTQERANGWRSEVWSNCLAAANMRFDDDIRIEAAGALAGIDARRVVFTTNSTAAVMFSLDGKLLLGGNGTLIDADGTTEQLTVHNLGPVAWGGNGTPVQFAAGRSMLALREMREGRVLRAFTYPTKAQIMRSNRFPILAATSDGRYVAAGVRSSDDARVVVWSGLTGEVLGETRRSATAMVFSPDGSLLSLAETNGTVVVYEVPGLHELYTLPYLGRGRSVQSLAFGQDRVIPYNAVESANRWLLAAGDNAGGVIVWSLTSSRARAFPSGSASPDGLLLASSDRSGVKLLDPISGRRLLKLTGQVNCTPWALAFNADGSRLASGSLARWSPGSLGVWELEQGRGIQVLRGLSANTRLVWFSPDNKRVAALADDWRLGIWDIASGRLLWLFETAIGVLADNAAVAFDVNSDRLAFAAGGEAQLYDLNVGRVVRSWKLSIGLTDQLQFDRQGRLLLFRRERGLDKEAMGVWRLLELSQGEIPMVLHEQARR